MLQALKILEGYPVAEYGSGDPRTLHLMAEALTSAFADRHRYVADPEALSVPVSVLLSEERAALHRGRISPERARQWPVEEIPIGSADPERNTSTFHVVDRYGNAAAVTASVGLTFLVAGDTGIHLNERIIMMPWEPTDVNVVAPGKKPRHTSNPYMVFRNGRVRIVGGNTGGDIQPQVQLQQVIGIVDFGMGAQEAVDAPRFYMRTFPSTIIPFRAENSLQIEHTVPAGVRNELSARGHRVRTGSYFGRGHMILIDDHAAGEIEVGVEPREYDSSGVVIP
jgi:gamma-glutamyltranspeptidase/glutathione hydrolase